MTTATVEPPVAIAEQQATAASKPARLRGRWLPLIVMAAHLPLLGVHLRNLWLRPHYQFFPLLLIGIGWLVWQRLPRDRTGVRKSSALENLLTLSGGTLLCLAFIFFTPWLGALAALLTCGGLLRRWSGKAAWRQVWPAWLLAWVILPPPFAIDIRITQSLQRLTAWFSSSILDMFDIKHLMEGTVLDFPGRSLLVEEACSGIQSLFTLVACTLFFLVYKRRGVFIGATLIAAAVFWALMANILRVVVIAWTYDRLGTDLASGWRHELLGFLVFGLAIAMLASTDALLYFLFGPVVIVPQRAPLTPMARFWNYFVSGARSADIARILGRPAPKVEATLDDPPAKSRRQRGFLGSPAYACLLGAVGLVQIAAIGIAESGVASTGRRMSTKQVIDRIDAEFGEPFFANVQPDWKLIDYRIEERDSRSDLGHYSRIWEFEAPFGTVILSFDYPFRGYHPLNVCYRNGGWRLGPQTTAVPAKADSVAHRNNGTEFEMSKPTGDNGYVCFSLFGRATEAVEQTPVTPGSWMRSKLGRSPLIWLLGAEPPSLDASSYQFQIFAASGSRLTQAERDELRRAYFAARDQLMQHWKKTVLQLEESPNAEAPLAAR